MHLTVLILDTAEADLGPLADTIKAACDPCDLHRVFSLERARERLATPDACDLFITDAILGEGAGDDPADARRIIETVRREHPELPIVAVASEADVDAVARTIQAGATDFLVRAGQLDERVETMLDKLRPQLELRRRNRVLAEQNRLLQHAQSERYQILGESPQILDVIERVERIAKIPRPVLVFGERGTGKELVARAVHLASGDPDRPMVVVNCAAFPDNLLESELFGHEKGAFTGADGRRLGKFELADGGTLFLDEIGHMSLPFQQKILRVVEYGSFTRVGGTDEVRVQTRVIAATNADLQRAIENGEFLPDLYDRLSFETIRVPPLRERVGDVELLARHFLARFMQEIPSLRGKVLSKEALAVLNRYGFPGNIRELKNIIERAAYRDTTNEISPEDIGMLPTDPLDPSAGDFEQRVEVYKKRLVLSALEAAGGNQAQAARSLGLSYHQLRYLLRKYEEPADA